MILEGFQLDKCIGLESRIMDGSSDIAVIKAPVAMVSKAIVQLNPKARIYAEALERIIQANSRGLILFQLRGFNWTILYRHKRSPNQPKRVKLLPQLSNVLKSRAMFLAITDTSFYTSHRVWDNGEIVEHFISDDEIIKLESQIRQVNETYVDHNALDDFYAEQGVYFPYIEIASESVENDDKSSFMFKVRGEFDWCLEKQFKGISYEKCTRMYELEGSDFEGLDYITFDE